MIDTSTPPPTNPLAAELRQIERDLLDPDQLLAVALERVRRLAEHVELLAAESATAELDAVTGGLEPEQEIVARAAQVAATALGPGIGAVVAAEAGPMTADDFAHARGLLLDLTEVVAELIRTGARP